MFEQYSTRYRAELDLVVKNISVDIKGGEKVGLVLRLFSIVFNCLLNNK